MIHRGTLDVGSLLITVFAAILEVFLICLAGYILAWKGILDKKTQKQINKINVSLFTPCLLFSKVAFSLSPEKLRELWVIPIFFIIVTTLSMCIAWILGTTFRLSKSQRSFAMAGAMFMNSNSLPVALMKSLVITVQGLKWFSDDDESAMLGRALSYLMLYSTFGLILRWSYGVHLLAQADDAMDSPIRLPPDGDEEGERRLRDLEASLPTTATSTVVDGNISTDRSHPPSVVVDNSSSGEPSPSGSFNENATLPVRPGLAPPNYIRKSSYFFRSFPNSPNQSRISLVNPEDMHVEREEEEEDGGRNAEPFARQPLHRRQSSRYSVQSQSEPPTALQAYLLYPLVNFWHVFTDFMTVPLYAAFLSIIVALAPSLQHALEVHLYPIKGALESSGSCSIPVTLVVLGAYFYKEKDPSVSGIPTTRMEDTGVTSNGVDVENRSSLPTSTRPSAVEHCRELFAKLKPTGKARKQRPPYLQTEDENKPLPGETKTVIVTLLSRMVLTPLVLMPLVTLAAKEDWHQVFEDPVFVVSNVLLIASPPALALAQITQAASGDAFERLISRTIFWSYCVATPPLMITYVVVGLLLTGI